MPQPGESGGITSRGPNTAVKEKYPEDVTGHGFPCFYLDSHGFHRFPYISRYFHGFP